MIPFETTVQLRAVRLFKHGAIHVVYGNSLLNGKYVVAVCEATAGQYYGTTARLDELPWTLIRITDNADFVQEYLKETPDDHRT